MNPDEYDDWAMEQARERSLRRRRWMVGVLLAALLGSVLIPVIQIFT